MREAMHFMASMYSGVGTVSRSPSNWGRSAIVVSCRAEMKPFAPSFNQSSGNPRSAATLRDSSRTRAAG
jgi:hypothetical protein